MKKSFTKGDRVRVYSHYGPYEGIVRDVDVSSANRYRRADGLIRVQTDLGEMWNAHPRQCVRLKKKEPSVRVTRKQLEEVWDKHEINSYFTYSTFKDFCKALGLPEEHPACVGRDED